MSTLQMLRALVDQRLTAAVEEIFVVLERTIAEYEAELSRTKEENYQLLDAVFKKHQVVSHRTDVQQVSAESHEEIPSKQQEWSSSVGQKELQAPSHIKEEEEELWKQLQRCLDASVCRKLTAALWMAQAQLISVWSAADAGQSNTPEVD
ncbi:uncharacterized protein LOC133546835 isoform X2 [Nerophis ophidion]|uniref:uncharacterized protein LOC133546835 isoform X2 n=1 Tax=Nerophis ophidion TaxID=159077 RepID=UPI002ADFB19C|nr:uncharacterized protein LOC133546835 isoform X2 [Nerophis ophidion]